MRGVFLTCTSSFRATWPHMTGPLAPRMGASISGTTMQRPRRLKRGRISKTDASGHVGASLPIIIDLFHDHCGDHAEHPVGALGVAQYVAVPGPGPGLRRLDEDVVTLPRCNEHCVCRIWVRQQVTVLRDNSLREPVQMHRVDLQALVHVTDPDYLVLGRDDRLRGWEALPVDRESQRTIVEDHHVVDVGLRFAGI